MISQLPTPPKAALKAALQTANAKRLYSSFQITPDAIDLRVDVFETSAVKPTREAARVSAALRPWANALIAAFLPFQLKAFDVGFSGAVGNASRVESSDAASAAAITRSFVDAQFLRVARRWDELLPGRDRVMLRVDARRRNAKTAFALKLNLFDAAAGGGVLRVQQADRSWIANLSGWTEGVKDFTIHLDLQRPSGHFLAVAMRRALGEESAA